MAKPEKFVRGPEATVVRYAHHLSNKPKPATKRALSLLFKLSEAGVLRARNAHQMTFMFSEVEDVISQEDSDYLEIYGHATAVRTAKVAGKPVDCEYTSKEEILKELKRLRGLRRSDPPSCSYFFTANSNLSSLDIGMEEWESENF